MVGLVESGVQAYTYRGARHLTTAGKVFLVNAGEPHTGEAAESTGYVYRTLYPSVDLLARVAESLGAKRAVPFFREDVVDDPLLARQLTRLHALVADRATPVELESQLYAALACLVRRHGDLATRPEPLARERAAVRLTRELIEACYADDLSLSKLAARASLSPYYLARAFARETGLPPHAYLESVRIGRARELIDRGMDLAGAAVAVGYSDQSHLTRRFKRFVGVTPGQYRREGKIRQDARRQA